MIQAIFLDFNGVIIDDERIHARTYREALEEYQVELKDEDYFASLGMNDVAFTRAAFTRVGRSVDDETMRAIIDREHQLHRSIIEAEVPFAPGVVTFIKEAAREFDLGIVSMAELSEIEHVLNKSNLLSYFSVIVSARPGLNHKPAPDCYRAALDDLTAKRREDRKPVVLPAEVLCIEESPPGIEAARAAGMRTVGETNTVARALLRAPGAGGVNATLADGEPDTGRL